MRATREWWGILLLGGLLFFGVAMLHRQTVREFPAAKWRPLECQESGRAV